MDVRAVGAVRVETRRHVHGRRVLDFGVHRIRRLRRIACSASTAGLVVASGFALARACALMPLYERLSLWFVPALYLGIALSADRAVWLLREKPLKHCVDEFAAAAVAIATVVRPSAWISLNAGFRTFALERPARQQSRDRRPRGCRMADGSSGRPGDVLITTHHALPAIWWYGGVSLRRIGRPSVSRWRADFLRRALTNLGASCRGRELDNGDRRPPHDSGLSRFRRHARRVLTICCWSSCRNSGRLPHYGTSPERAARR